MTEILSGLLLYPTFRDLPMPQLVATTPLWGGRRLDAGETVWNQADDADGVAIVLRGEVVAEMDGVELARIGNGGILGEMSAFSADAKRVGTMRATQPTDLALLSRSSLAAVRAEHPLVYDAILGQALRAVVRRVRAVDRRISARAFGAVQAPVRSNPGALARMWRTLAPGLPKGPCPSLTPLLRLHPALAAADDAVLEQVSSVFVAQALPEGHVLYLEGDASVGACVIASGGVDVIRCAREDRAERLASVRAGDLLGINSLIEREARTASCVTSAPTWIWTIDAEASAGLSGDAGFRWRESMLIALAGQIRSAHQVLVRVANDSVGDLPTGADMDRLMRAQGYLEGLPIVERDRATAPTPLPPGGDFPI